MASAAPDTLELTGILATTDSYERLRLCLVDVLETPAYEGGRPASDHSWARLREAVPESKTYNVPYNFPLNGAPDDAGIRGECWVTLPTPAKGARGRAAREQRARILALAEELRGKEVVLTVRPKRYSFVSQAAHNHGAEVAGTSLQFVGLEPRTSRPRAPADL
jgi:hypothetical protein